MDIIWTINSYILAFQTSEQPWPDNSASPKKMFLNLNIISECREDLLQTSCMTTGLKDTQKERRRETVSLKAELRLFLLKELSIALQPQHRLIHVLTAWRAGGTQLSTQMRSVLVSEGSYRV